jgi:hypothetical protein
MPEGFDPESQHYQNTLLGTSIEGVRNFSVIPNIFAFIESGDSLICIADVPETRNRTPEAVAFEDWVNWIGISQYTWKVAWELDRGLYIILNLVTSHLKHKRTEEYRDVYAVNALINHLKLFLDTHNPRNMTTTYYTIHFLEKISEEWRTGELLTSANEKMESLRELIAQLDEIEQSRRDRRTEMFLTFIGVFAFGSLILDFIGAMSFASEMSDFILAALTFGIPTIFLVVAYYLLRE